ncbi:MAG: hypothetical protein R2851_10115 [Caldilineaceae bacterium]
MATRVTDYALLIGHVWRCTACRDNLLEHPETMWIGYKLSEHQRDAIRELTVEHFQTATALAKATGLDVDDLYEGIDHPGAAAPSRQRQERSILRGAIRSDPSRAVPQLRWMRQSHGVLCAPLCRNSP